MKKGLTPAFVKQLQEAAEAGQVVLIPTLAEAALLPPPLPAIPLRGRDEASLAVALCLTFELTRSEAQMLAKLMASEYSTYSELHIAANRNNNETTALRSVPVRLCYLRKKLAAYDIGITTLRKLGYGLRREAREKICRQLVEYDARFIATTPRRKTKLKAASPPKRRRQTPAPTETPTTGTLQERA
jgi:hypothetical protein